MYLSEGNHKLLEGFLIWSIPSQSTCIGSSPLCRKHCYAKKAERLYPNCIPSRQKNYLLTKTDRFVEDMICCIRAKELNYNKFNKHFRIHESGDFYSQDYLDKWMVIADYYKHIRFLAYTSAYKLDYSKKPQNMEIVMSVWKDREKVPDGFPKYFVGMTGENSIPCESTCNLCLKCWHLTLLKKDVHTNIK